MLVQIHTQKKVPPYEFVDFVGQSEECGIIQLAKEIRENFTLKDDEVFVMINQDHPKFIMQVVE